MSDIKTYFFDLINTFTILSLLDILIMTFIIYYIIKIIRGTQAEYVVKGIIIVLLITQVSDWLNLVTVNFLFRNIITVGFIALLIMFQPELRRTLERLGSTKVLSWKAFFNPSENKKLPDMIDEIVAALLHLSAKKTGALIVMQRSTPIKDIISTGIKIEADKVSAQLLENIFYPNTPLHDGAVVINSKECVLEAAACLLPLTQNQTIDMALGTRHRSAIGMSENADCLVLVVSEETGAISYAFAGEIIRFLDEEKLRSILKEMLEEQDSVIKDAIASKINNINSDKEEDSDV